MFKNRKKKTNSWRNNESLDHLKFRLCEFLADSSLQQRLMSAVDGDHRQVK